MSQVTRNTPVRRHLIQALAMAEGPLSAADLISSLDKAGLSANKTTVYRQLESLVEQGVVTRLNLDADRKSYEIAKGASAHPHLICTSCGSVECLPEDEALILALTAMASTREFTSSQISLEVYGTCRVCAKEQQ